ncbi:MAG: murein biosynthesis integral membrane protein MurJ [Clostridiaceae bacterium]|nr:murein biosynthesis integral membrane protein MurJ [Clostridiaceae bacterium]
MKRATILIMSITIISKVLGFARELVLSYIYGASAITDAYLISQMIPTQIFSLISVGLATAFIPMYSRVIKERGEGAANSYVSNLMSALFLLITIIAGFVFLFPHHIVRLFATGFDEDTLNLAVNFTNIAIFGVYFTVSFNIFAAYLRIKGRFALPEIVNLPMNLILIGSLFISAKTNLIALAWGSLLATATQFILLIPAIRKEGYKYKAGLHLNDNYLRTMALLALPVMLSHSVDRINVLIDRRLASVIAIGGISALNYADRLGGFIRGFFVNSVATVLYPTISKMAIEDNMQGLKSSIVEAMVMICLIVIPSAIGAMLFSEQIVVLLLGRGAFTVKAATMTAVALFYYSIGLIPTGLESILARAFYALQDTKTPMINATIGVVINIVLNFILSKYMGIGGLALATSISAIVTAILMFITLRKKIGPFGLKELTKSFIKISIASLIMGLIAYGSFILSGSYLSQNLSLIMAIGIGALTYATIIYFMKIPEVDSTIIAIKNKLKSFKQK